MKKTIRRTSLVASASLAASAAPLLARAEAAVSFTNPFRVGTSLYQFIVTVIDNIILPVGAVIVVIFLIFAGFQFVMARGNPTEIAKARSNFIWVVVGSSILLGAWLIARIVQNTVMNIRS